MPDQTVDVMLDWHHQDAALAYAKDLEVRGWHVRLRPVLETGSNWRWHLLASLPNRPATRER